MTKIKSSKEKIIKKETKFPGGLITLIAWTTLSLLLVISQIFTGPYGYFVKITMEGTNLIFSSLLVIAIGLLLYGLIKRKYYAFILGIVWSLINIIWMIIEFIKSTFPLNETYTITSLIFLIVISIIPVIFYIFMIWYLYTRQYLFARTKIK